ncbi:unnamed protein product [Tetraodon nigroviridis]|uniref:(spotted green pufferfish) hypothetical protein n=1 Tax=Tetraodon nigroviridis TaxID=99883 RepID=Q4S4J1_TETNG|nr:unnamed protein product [Tetraodon nigroviridis]
MDSSCSSSWTVGPTKPSDTLRVKAPGCLGSASGAAVFNTTPSSVDRPKEQGDQVTPAFCHPNTHTETDSLTSVACRRRPSAKHFGVSKA